jgi:hypothetical protein
MRLKYYPTEVKHRLERLAKAVGRGYSGDLLCVLASLRLDESEYGQERALSSESFDKIVNAFWLGLRAQVQRGEKLQESGAGGRWILLGVDLVFLAVTVRALRHMLSKNASRAT